MLCVAPLILSHLHVITLSPDSIVIIIPDLIHLISDVRLEFMLGTKVTTHNLERSLRLNNTNRGQYFSLAKK